MTDDCYDEMMSFAHKKNRKNSPLKDLLGTERYEEVMRVVNSDEEEDLFDEPSFEEGQQYTDEEQEEDVDDKEEDDEDKEEDQEDKEEDQEEEHEEQEDDMDISQTEASAVFLPRRSPRKKKQVVTFGSQEPTSTQEDDLPTITHKKRPAKKPAIPEYVEDELVEWLETQELMYVKANPLYKNTERKMRIWNAKANSLAAVGVTITGQELHKWYEKMCRLARTKNKPLPSGSAREMSSQQRRQEELRNQLSWLTPFLETAAGETPVKTKRALASRPANATSIPDSSSEDHEGPQYTSTPTVSTGGPTPGPSRQLLFKKSVRGQKKTSSQHSSSNEQHSRQASQQQSRPSRRGNRRKPSQPPPPSPDTLGHRMQQFEDLLEQVLVKLHESEMPEESRGRKMFLDSMYIEVLQHLPYEVWHQFQKEYMALIAKYRMQYFSQGPDNQPRPQVQPAFNYY